MPKILLPLVGPRMDSAGARLSASKCFLFRWLTRTHSMEQLFLISGYHTPNVVKESPALV